MADSLRVVAIEDCPDINHTWNDEKKWRDKIGCPSCDGRGWVPVGNVIEGAKEIMAYGIKAMLDPDSRDGMTIKISVERFGLPMGSD